MKVRFSLIQMDIEFAAPEINLERTLTFLEKAVADRADIAVLPEMWSCGYDLGNIGEHAAKTPYIVEKLAAFAKKNTISIHAGTLPAETDTLLSKKRYTNRAYFIDKNGIIVSQYDKVHLFRLMNEDKFFKAGNKIGVFDSEYGKIGMLTCYDLRFPEAFRSLALQGADIIILPAQWPNPRLSHWMTLAVARAIENQLFIIAVNRVGSDPKSTFFGHSMVINPWGEILADAGSANESVLTVEIETELIASVRSKIPVFLDRTPACYSMAIVSEIP